MTAYRPIVIIDNSHDKRIVRVEICRETGSRSLSPFIRKVDIDDLTRLRRYNAEASTVIFPGADVNGDGTVDIGDLTRLRRYFAEEAVVLGK